MTAFKIHIVEDDPWYGELLQYHLSQNPDHEVKRFNSAKECLSNLSQKPDLITIDYTLPDMDGEQLLKKIKETSADVPLIIISGQESIATAIQMLQAGAYDYFVKDDNTKDRLWNSIIKLRENRELKNEIASLRDEVERKYSFEKSIIGESAPIQSIFKLIEKASGSNINVSITGETGTGKEVVAKAIHFNSARQKKPFIAVNMSAIPGELLESELFGYEKGAFTGAYMRKTGRFEEANKGTLFLDEIADLDLNLQSKLLRVIQEKELMRIGGNELIKLDVRLIVATHKNLAAEVSKGNFREDLYYRVIGLPVELPPLRERGNDILILAEHFLGEFCRENKIPQFTISDDANQKLMRYNYPGNVRELKSMIELAAVMAESTEIGPDHIRFSGINNESEFLIEETTMENYKKRIISHFLKKYDNNVIVVAKKLDMGKSTIYNMLQANELN